MGHDEEVRQVHGLVKLAAGSGDLFHGRLRLHRGSKVKAVTLTAAEDCVNVHTDRMPPHTPVDMYNVRITKAASRAGETVLFQERGIRLCAVPV